MKEKGDRCGEVRSYERIWGSAKEGTSKEVRWSILDGKPTGVISPSLHVIPIIIMILYCNYNNDNSHSNTEVIIIIIMPLLVLNSGCYRTGQDRTGQDRTVHYPVLSTVQTDSPRKPLRSWQGAASSSGRRTVHICWKWVGRSLRGSDPARQE